MDLVGWLQFLWSFAVLTVQLAITSTVGTILLAAILAMLRVGRFRTLRAYARIQTDFFRSIPLLVLLLFLYYALAPHLAFFGRDPFWVGVLALSLSESAYLAEVYRGAIESIPAQQWDAAASIGLTWWRTMRLVVLPQAVPAGIPGTVNIAVGVVKDSSLASLIAVPEVTLGATILVSNTFLPFQVYLVLAGIYFVMVVPLAYLARYSEHVVAGRIGLRAVALGSSGVRAP